MATRNITSCPTELVTQGAQSKPVGRPHDETSQAHLLRKMKDTKKRCDNQWSVVVSHTHFDIEMRVENVSF